jgi:hypothetical protein
MREETTEGREADGRMEKWTGEGCCCAAGHPSGNAEAKKTKKSRLVVLRAKREGSEAREVAVRFVVPRRGLQHHLYE